MSITPVTGTVTIVPVTADVVQNGRNLQAAIDAASLGDELLLAAGATFQGPIVLREKSGAGWLTIRTSTPDANFVPEGTRVGPGNAALMPTLIAPDTNSVISTEAGAHHYRLLGLELKVADSVTLNYAVVSLGTGAETAYSQLPHHLILDRMYIHGSPICNCKRGVGVDSRTTSIVDSYFSDFHAVGQDTQAILVWNGDGPIKISNNYLEGAAENLMLGGADSSIGFQAVVLGATTQNATLSSVADLAAGQDVQFTVGGHTGYLPWTSTGSNTYTTIRSINGTSVTFDPLPIAPDINGTVYWGSVPQDVEISGNYFFKPLSWNVNLPTYAGGPTWEVKNLLEIKTGKRVLIENNLLQNSWIDAQDGAGIELKSVNQDGGCPWCVSADITLLNNVVLGVVQTFEFGGAQSGSPALYPPSLQRVSVRNSIGISAGAPIILSAYISDLQFDHNTLLGTYNVLSVNATDAFPYLPVPLPRFVFTNNIEEYNYYGLNQQLITQFFSPYSWQYNVYLNATAPTDRSIGNAVMESFFPPNNFAVTGLSGAGFVNLSAGLSGSDVRGLALASTSPFKQKASDGTDIGADANAIYQSTHYPDPQNAIMAVITNKSGMSNGRLWTFSFANHGTQTAYSLTIGGLSLVQQGGASCNPVVVTPLPMSLGNAVPGGTVDGKVLLDFSSCAPAARFKINMPFTSQTASGQLILNNQFE